MIADLQNQLGIDKTFFFELALFIVLYLWLAAVFFSPYISLHQRRRRGTEGLKKEAVAMAALATEKELARARALLAARKEAAAERESILVLARKSAAEQIAVAKSEARVRVSASRESAEKRASAELELLRPSVAPLSQMMIDKLTQKRVGV